MSTVQEKQVIYNLWEKKKKIATASPLTELTNVWIVFFGYLYTFF